jgi:thiamine biosynthesis protein ThiS
VDIVLNGQSRRVRDGISLAELIAELGMQPRFVAVECNRQLVPRGHHTEHRLHAGDQVEIVTLVGGG